MKSDTRECYVKFWRIVFYYHTVLITTLHEELYAVWRNELKSLLPASTFTSPLVCVHFIMNFEPLAVQLRITENLCSL